MIKKILPKFLKDKLKKYIVSFKSPNMIYGYKDSTNRFKPHTRYSDTAYFCHHENMKIADNVFIGHYTILDGTGGLEIGEGSQIAAYTNIITHSSHMTIRLYGKQYLKVPEEEKKAIITASVKIGKYVFIGSGSIILAGVTIGNGSIIYAGSVVGKDIPPYSIVKGNLAKVVGKIDKIDLKYLKKYPELKEYYFNQAFFHISNL